MQSIDKSLPTTTIQRSSILGIKGRCSWLRWQNVNSDHHRSAPLLKFIKKESEVLNGFVDACYVSQLFSSRWEPFPLSSFSQTTGIPHLLSHQCHFYCRDLSLQRFHKLVPGNTGNQTGRSQKGWKVLRSKHGCSCHVFHGFFSSTNGQTGSMNRMKHSNSSS